MDSIGDYIYLIIILIAAASSLLGKIKKKPSEEQNSNPDLPDLDDVLSDAPEYEEPARTVYKPLRKKEKYIDIPSYDTIDDFSVLRAKKQVVHPAKHFIASEVIELQDESFNILELETPDEVKKAFIYSEIFQRKYS